MSTSRLDTSALFGSAKANSLRLKLPADALHVRNNGIEFHSDSPIADWTELSVDLACPLGGKKIHGTGVVVSCTGNRAAGYDICVLFMHMSKQAQDGLDRLAFANLARA